MTIRAGEALFKFCKALLLITLLSGVVSSCAQRPGTPSKTYTPTHSAQRSTSTPVPGAQSSCPPGVSAGTGSPISSSKPIQPHFPRKHPMVEMWDQARQASSQRTLTGSRRSCYYNQLAFLNGERGWPQSSTVGGIFECNLLGFQHSLQSNFSGLQPSPSRLTNRIGLPFLLAGRILSA